MKPALLTISCLLVLTCGTPEKTSTIAIVGAVLIDGTGAAPVDDSVVLIAGSRIRAVGTRTATPISAAYQKVDARGLYLLPALYRVPAGQLPYVSTEKELLQVVDAGARAVAGMVTDKDVTGTELADHLRRLDVVMVPALSRIQGSLAALNTAKHNTAALARSGVRMGLAAGGAEQLELELLVESGMPSSEIIRAATSNGALAAGRATEAGTIEAGKYADLVLLSANPLDDARNLRKVEKKMVRGEWTLAK